MQRGRPQWLHFNRMIPNILTLTAICAGMTAIRFAFLDRWEHAILSLLVAAILDALDGRIARVLKGSSKFGAELDSLSDFICFGVAPAFVLYLWAMVDAGRFGWMLALLFSVCCALRLARFNTMMEDVDQPAWTRNFFSGVPSPAAAGLVVLPMILSFQIGDGYFRSPATVSVFMVTVAVLMVSPIPTFSFKRIKVPHKLVLPTMLSVGLLTAALISAPWITLAAILFCYIATIPLSIRGYRKHKADDKAKETPAE